MVVVVDDYDVVDDVVVDVNVDVDVDDGDLVGDVVVEEIPVCSLRRCWQSRRIVRILLTAENSILSKFKFTLLCYFTIVILWL